MIPRRLKPESLTGLLLHGQGRATAVWNVIMLVSFAMPFCCSGSFLGFLGAADLVLSLALCVGVALQGTFLPATSAACDDASNWKNAPDGRNFFVVANGTKGFSDKGPTAVCRQVMAYWFLSILVMYGSMVTDSTNSQNPLVTP